jgi:bifunctional non-homologous end joining protein LigD
MSPALPQIEPMLARDAKRLPDGEGWAFEIKWDGIRALALLGADGAAPRLVSRRGENLSARYPELADAATAPAGHEAVLDGEIVTFDGDGKPSFQLLQRRMGLVNPITIERRVSETPVSFIAFDLLALDGEPRIDEPYLLRRELLESIGVDGVRWQIPRHHLGDGAALLEAARRQGLEGVVAKRANSPYRSGRRSGEWLKVRLKHRQDFVIGGWYRGEGGRSGRLGSLLLGVWDRTPEEATSTGNPQRLVFAGGVGSGLAQRTIADLERMMESLASDVNPFELGVGPKRADPVFVEPRLVCSVEFSEWTREDTLRQPAFKGMRDDIDPATVVREPI